MSKSFKQEQNPALQYITEYTHNTHNTEDTHNTQYTHNTDNTHKSERKSKRLNLLIQPSLLEDITKIATMQQTSVNSLIHSLLQEYREREAPAINSYNKIFKEKEQTK